MKQITKKRVRERERGERERERREREREGEIKKTRTLVVEKEVLKNKHKNVYSAVKKRRGWFGADKGGTKNAEDINESMNRCGNKRSRS